MGIDLTGLPSSSEIRFSYPEERRQRSFSDAIASPARPLRELKAHFSLEIVLIAGQAVTYGSAGGKLPLGKGAARSPALSFAAAVRKAATNRE